ncbi:MAG: 3'-5' exoribonuclease [Chloroflexi bacterium]|nr:3'-5' exoribonuclease [Chloroflexota bacterium]
MVEGIFIGLLEHCQSRAPGLDSGVGPIIDAGRTHGGLAALERRPVTGPLADAYVSLDLETTGVDPASDAIVEIGAVKFQGSRALDTFSTFVNPDRPLPAFVSLLTGITPDDLRHAPPLASVLPDLARFLGALPIVGHSISFDLAFLQRAGIATPGPAYDTRDLSRLLLPSLPEHNLAAVVQALGVTNDHPHRALSDATATMAAFCRLLSILEELQPQSLGTVLSMLQRHDTAIGSLVRGAAVARPPQAETAQGPAPFLQALRSRLQTRPPTGARRPRLVQEPLDPKTVAAVFHPGGPLARALGAFEARTSQVKMAQSVTSAFNTGEGEGATLLAEAGPGTGKTLAYLVPALLFVQANGQPVVVSTSTHSLQEQLLTKDVPDALRALDLEGRIRVASLKGRGNYLCLRRLERALSRPDLSAEEALFLSRLLVWLETTSTGDGGELSLLPPEEPLWNALTAQNADARDEGAVCPYMKEGTCFLARARREAQAADLVITNHALLLADAVHGSSILSHCHHLILDEAHHLDREATEQFGQRVAWREVTDAVRSLGGVGQGLPSFLPGLLARARVAGAGQPLLQSLRKASEEVARRGEQVSGKAKGLFTLLDGLLAAHERERAEGRGPLRLSRALRRLSAGAQVQRAWEELDASLTSLSRALEDTIAIAGRAAEAEGESALLDSSLRVKDLHARLSLVLARPEEGVAWVERTWDAEENLLLRWAPLFPGPYLRESLFAGKETVVLTSATLSVGGSFQHLRSVLGLEEAKELSLESPFDYNAAEAVFIPRDIPEPEAAGYRQGLAQALIAAAQAAGGHTLGLLTSNSSLRQAYIAIKGPLEQEGIAVLAQGIDGSAARLVGLFRSHPRAVLLGTASLWEGIDLASPALRVVVVARLPFQPPDNPLLAARSEGYSDPFHDYALPEALLRFRQGVGRLIRRKGDRGAIVLLDGRILRRGYGPAFLQALPTSTISTPHLKDLADELAAWLGGPAS